jgi:tRNA1(Val) A37 N6-methylase TrmN6
MAEFSQQSTHFHKAISKADRQAAGIFFTPKQARDRLWELVQQYSPAPRNILEPSAGSGEFVADAIAKYPRAKITAVELNADMAAALATANPKAETHNQDFLSYKSASTYDLIVGNPPYFQTKAKDPRCMTGRGNIFVQFIYKCLAEHLAPQGILAFVLPTSFYNCAYYEPCRRYIATEHTILHVETLANTTPWHETAQETMIMLVQATPPTNQSYIFYPRATPDVTYITPYASELTTLTADTTTFEELGFTVKTGGIVWSEHKHGNSKKCREFELSDDPDDDLLIYSSNIGAEGEIELFDVAQGQQRNGKKQYIKNAGTPLVGPAFLIARGYGNCKYKLDFAVVPEGVRFHAENHLNVITSEEPAEAALVEQICASLRSQKTEEFLNMFLGNGALSASELACVLPIF